MRTSGFEKINSRQVFYILNQPNSESKKIVIMSHGFRGSSIGPSRAFVDLERVLEKDGFCVLRLDQPGSGNSEGDFLSSSFDEWVDTIEYFAKKYIGEGFQVSLFGQSMGATASVVASAKNELEGNIKCILLWVPDPKSNVNVEADKIYEEDGQIYKGSFWIEASASDFFDCLKKFNGGIHLVYGEEDRYISKDLRTKVIDVVKEKGQSFIILKGQDHSPWDFKVAQKIYDHQLSTLKKHHL
jgi:esterase/lipase